MFHKSISISKYLQLIVLCLVMLSGGTTSVRSSEDCLSLIAYDDKFIREISKRLSASLNNSAICHALSYYPANRADILFENPEFDGFIARPIEFQDNSPVRVSMLPIPLHVSDAILVAQDPNIKEVSDLDGQVIGIVRGWDWMEKITAKIENKVTAASLSDLVEMFHRKHLNAMITTSSAISASGLIVYPNHYIMKLSLNLFLKEAFDQKLEAVKRSLKDYSKIWEIANSTQKMGH